MKEHSHISSNSGRGLKTLREKAALCTSYFSVGRRIQRPQTFRSVFLGRRVIETTKQTDLARYSCSCLVAIHLITPQNNSASSQDRNPGAVIIIDWSH